MDKNLVRAYLVEMIGAFALVYFGAGAVCVNQLATPAGQQPPVLNGHQPGLVGIALAQGLILAVMLAVTVPVSGGYLNPGITIMLWVFNRLDSIKAVWLLGAQLLGAVLAGMCLRYTFDMEVLRAARLGTPHVNPAVYHVLDRSTLLAGSGVELILTFFLVLAIFGIMPQGGRGGASMWAGAALSAGILVGYPLTGAATNPARWFGPVLWEWAVIEPVAERGPLSDVFVYVAGPILGALLAGLFCFKFLTVPTPADAQSPAAAGDGLRAGPTQTKAKR
jgi:glycerol uptake facilitator-like aquaporin